MSRLINFGPGEIADRLSVLALKIHYGQSAGKATAHLENERNALLTQLRGRNGIASWLEWWLELNAVNSALWTATDQIRVIAEGDGTARAGEIGIRILRLNDRRAELVDLINKQTGDWLGPEKLHAGGPNER